MNYTSKINKTVSRSKILQFRIFSTPCRYILNSIDFSLLKDFWSSYYFKNESVFLDSVDIWSDCCTQNMEKSCLSLLEAGPTTVSTYPFCGELELRKLHLTR
jgi:hypothetical protein